jgi:CHAD domain-containing protein
MMKGLDNDKFKSLQEQITQDQKENEASKRQIACWKNTHQMTNHEGIWCVTVSPSPQSQIKEEEKLHALRKYARDFRRQHTTDAQDFHWDSEDEDYGLAIGRLVVT